MDQAPLVRDDHEPTAEAHDAPRANERTPPRPRAAAPTLHFVAGLPRTGSTALVTLLHQNPRILGAPVSGLGQTVRQTLLNWDRDPHHQERPDHGAKMRCVRALLDSYHPAGRPIVVDKQRAWIALIPALEAALGRRIRVVVSVRPIVDILASFEVLRARDPTFPTLADRALGPRSHVETRARFYMGPGGVLSQTLGAMRAAVDGGFLDRMLFVDYDLLTADPRGQLRRLYAFLDEPYFEHELQRVEPRGAFDSRHHGFIGLHDVRPQFGKVQRSAREILGGAVYEAYAGPAPWDGFTRAAPRP